MTDGNRGKSNARLRIDLDAKIMAIPIGTEIKINHLAREFQQTDSRLWMTPRRVSCLVRERDDMMRVGDGIWQKVQV